MRLPEINMHTAIQQFDVDFFLKKSLLLTKAAYIR